jgi:hypothetical protein
MTAEEWGRLMLAMAILGALFAFPIISIWHDERRKRRDSAEPTQEPVDEPIRR